MAVVHRIFNSTRPFSMSTHQPKNMALGCLHPTPEPHAAGTAGKNSELHELILPTDLLKAISQGTAKHVGTGPLGTEKLSFIAQAECESQDSQEFCPNSRHKNVTYDNVSAALACTQGSASRRRRRKKRQKRHQKRQGEREGQQRDGGSERVRERRLTGVPEQDSGAVEECSYSSPSSRSYSSSSSRAVNTESLSVQETAQPSYSSQFNLHSTPLSSAEPWRQLQTQPSCDCYGRKCESSVDSSLISETECSLAVLGLRNYVTQTERSYAPAFVREMVRAEEARQEEKDEEEEREESDTNEGILFEEKLKPQNYEYREGRDYEVCNLIKQGSYGDVYSIRDKSSGFVCAAKKVAFKSFSSEEVGSWSALQAPHVVKLFGFVREGSSIIIFMDLKPGSLGQLLKERGRLPEDLSLHYLHQVLGALEHLHKKRILHLDIKADNVLLSEDGKDAFLCDFGHSEQLDHHGFSPYKSLKGTETHMAPEVARGEKRCAKADVWSSCCMLLHMLNGCQPWTRYYFSPLCLKIAEEPPPLREIQSDCSPHTADALNWGLQKEPSRRASAKDLRLQTAKALKQLGGLRSPARGGAYQTPIGKPERHDPAPLSHSSVQQWMGPGQEWREEAEVRAGLGHKSTNDGEPEEVEDEEEEPEEDEVKDEEQEDVRRIEGCPSQASTLYVHPPNPEPSELTEQELQLRKLERDFFLSSLSQPHSAELQEQLLSCLGSDCPSAREPWDKKDSGRWSVGPGDDLSSGVFSYNSQSDGQSFSMDWLVPAHKPPPRCFEGVDVCIRDFNGRCFRIRETPRVKVGHIAVGISDQISESVFSLQGEDGSLVPHDKEVQETGLFLRCVPAPDCSHAPGCKRAPDCRHAPCCKTPWSWRIRDGVLETKDWSLLS